jgi:hypothetical protein
MRAAQPPKFNQANSQQAPTGPSREDWEKMYFARDDRGQRLVQTDPGYAKRVEQLRDKVFGTEQQIATPGALTAQELLQGFKSTRLQLPSEMAMGILSPWRWISQTQSCQAAPIQLQPRL